MVATESSHPGHREGSQTRAQPNWLYHALLIGLGLLALTPRFNQLKGMLSGKYLWAEDAPIFMNMAQAHGFSAIFETYAGYIHLYPKITAYLANYFDLAVRPAIYFLSWTVAFSVLIFSVARAARILKAGPFSTAILVLLVALQPTYGDVLFNVTNAQWMLGGAMFLLVLVDDAKSTLSENYAKAIFILPMALTGPFSIILLPLIAIKIFAYRDWAKNKVVYLVVSLGAAVQLLFILKTGRATYLETTPSVWDFALAFMQLALFGANSVGAMGIALLFWTTLALAMQGTNISRKIPGLLLLFAAFLVLLSVLYSVKNAPLAAVSLDGGNRFTWIPYTLLFCAAIFVSVQQRIYQFLLIGSAATLCLLHFHQAAYEDYQFQSLAKLAQIKEVGIPINPAGIYFVVGVPDLKGPGVEYELLQINSKSMQTFMMEAQPEGSEFDFKSTGPDPVLQLQQPILCKEATDIVLEIEMTRDVAGPVQLFWNEFPGFSEKHSLTREFPSGRITAQFGIETRGRPLYIRLDPMTNKGSVKFENFAAYCLK